MFMHLCRASSTDVIDHDELRYHDDLKELRFVDALSEGLKQSMDRHSELILMGQDIAEYGGAFKVTEGFSATYGKARVRNTPLCESGHHRRRIGS